MYVFNVDNPTKILEISYSIVTIRKNPDGGELRRTHKETCPPNSKMGKFLLSVSGFMTDNMVALPDDVFSGDKLEQEGRKEDGADGAEQSITLTDN
jgi:hypothetical protein